MSLKSLIPRFKPQFSFKELIAAFFPRKNAIQAYEEAFATKFGCQHGLMFPHGRSGLYSLFKVWELEGAEIICPAYTCVVVQHAIVKSGNVPVFVDCAEGSFNMSYEGIEQAITKKTRCVVVTHLFGYPMNVNRINEIVDKAQERYGQKIYVVQDAAHSYGAKWEGELVTSFGDAAIFGSNISKLMNSIFGGMVITNDVNCHNALQKFREAHFKPSGWLRRMKMRCYLTAVFVAFNEWVYALVNWLERKGVLDRFIKYYDEGVIDFPADWDQMPTSVEASVGLIQLSKYDGIIAARRSNSRQIIAALRDDDRFTFMEQDHEGCTYSHLVALVEDREAMVEEYRKKGIQLGILIEYVVPNMKAYLSYKTGEFPVAEHFHTRSINFPIFKKWM